MEALRGPSGLFLQRPRCKFPNLAATPPSPQKAHWRGTLHPSGRSQRKRAGQDPREICLYLSATLTHSLSVGQYTFFEPNIVPGSILGFVDKGINQIVCFSKSSQSNGERDMNTSNHLALCSMPQQKGASGGVMCLLMQDLLCTCHVLGTVL